MIARCVLFGVLVASCLAGCGGGSSKLKVENPALPWVAPDPEDLVEAEEEPDEPAEPDADATGDEE